MHRDASNGDRFQRRAQRLLGLGVAALGAVGAPRCALGDRDGRPARGHRGLLVVVVRRRRPRDPRPSAGTAARPLPAHDGEPEDDLRSGARPLDARVLPRRRRRWRWSFPNATTTAVARPGATCRCRASDRADCRASRSGQPQFAGAPAPALLRRRGRGRRGRRAGAGLPNCWSSARLTASTLTRGSPKTPRSRPWTRLSMTCAMRSGATWRARAMRGTCQSAACGDSSGSRPLAEVVTSSAGIGSGASGFSLRRRSTSAATRSRSFFDVGPEVRPRRRRRVVAVAGRRRAPLQVGRVRERLADELGADHRRPSRRAPGCRWPCRGTAPGRRRSWPADR